MRIALGQLESGADIRANLAAIDRFAAEAARDGAALVAFPEYATYEKKKVDATVPRGRRAAGRAGLPRPRRHSPPPRASRWWPGVVETSGGARPRVQHAGGLRARRRPAGLLPEDPPFRCPGLRGVDVHQAGPVHDACGVRATGSPLRPDDLLRPAVPRAGQVSWPTPGPQVLLVCSSWVPGEHKTGQWLALNAARAIENRVYVAGPCQAPPVSVGRSLLVGPMGVVEADLGLKPGVRTVEISRAALASVRQQFPTAEQRRLMPPRSEVL